MSTGEFKSLGWLWATESVRPAGRSKRLPRRRGPLLPDLPIGCSWTWLRNKLFEKAARRAGGVDELEKKVFRMAAGGEDGCRLVRDQHFIKKLVDTMGSWIEAQDLAVPGLIDIAEGQPLRLKLIRAILQAADPDRDFLLQAETGLPVGILEPLPRTPHVFEPQEKWPLENTWEPALAWVPNYGSTRPPRLCQGEV